MFFSPILRIFLISSIVVVTDTPDIKNTLTLLLNYSIFTAYRDDYKTLLGTTLTI